MNIEKKIYIGSDHAGFELKEKIKEYFISENLSYEDMGNVVYDKEDDYPDFAEAVAEKVKSTGSLGVLLCHNGVGVCIAANKVKGIRAVNTDSVQIAIEARKDDYVNVLCLPGAYISLDEAIKIITAWVETEYGTAERYQRRVDKVEKIENKN